MLIKVEQFYFISSNPYTKFASSKPGIIHQSDIYKTLPMYVSLNSKESFSEANHGDRIIAILEYNARGRLYNTTSPEGILDFYRPFRRWVQLSLSFYSFSAVY